MNEIRKFSPDEKHLSIADFRKLTADERFAILEAQAALAADLYREVKGELDPKLVAID